ncbi:MAG: Preprotein translocase subunit Sec61beta [Candidatus Methanohalarchaeum thermophilum]|uniref:Preprotein translocase subunit SecG n=1 Tax=Methanohalarchaeum thermophilum TaxID=1903181 RepID=A0A1Q6DTJ7_METT1|nr:MAG: Preprotein translocase subunit Sec61beta [Candidatus Methanohalarchaeum thermophilum]
MSKQKGSGLTSSAGLMRYFEEEGQDTPKFSPKSVIIFGALIGVVILSLNIYYGLWP